MIGIIIGGIVLILIGVGLYFVGKSQARKLRQIKSVEPSTAQELKDTAQAVSKEMGESGVFHQICELNGLVKCDSPLTSEIAKQQCVYYKMSVEREYEENYTETDTDGNTLHKTRRSSETVSSNTQSIPFYVEDATGRVLINPNSADIDAVQVVDRFDQEEAGKTKFGFGSFTLDIGGLRLGNSGNRTLGYRFKEWLLPMDRRVYVLGEAVDSSGELTVQKPKEKGKKFIISVKSEEELVASIGGTIKWLTAGAAACAAIGVILLITSPFVR